MESPQVEVQIQAEESLAAGECPEPRDGVLDANLSKAKGSISCNVCSLVFFMYSGALSRSGQKAFCFFFTAA